MSKYCSFSHIVLSSQHTSTFLLNYIIKLVYARSLVTPGWHDNGILKPETTQCKMTPLLFPSWKRSGVKVQVYFNCRVTRLAQRGWAAYRTACIICHRPSFSSFVGELENSELWMYFSLTTAIKSIRILSMSHLSLVRETGYVLH